MTQGSMLGLLFNSLVFKTMLKDEDLIYIFSIIEILDIFDNRL